MISFIDIIFITVWKILENYESSEQKNKENQTNKNTQIHTSKHKVYGYIIGLIFYTPSTIFFGFSLDFIVDIVDTIYQKQKQRRKKLRKSTLVYLPTSTIFPIHSFFEGTCWSTRKIILKNKVSTKKKKNLNKKIK